MQNKILATTFGYIMALLFITIRTDNICFDDGSQQILRVFSSRSRISLLKITKESNTKPETSVLPWRKQSVRYVCNQSKGPFRRFSMCVWQIAHTNTVRRAMVCNVYFPFSKIFKGIMHRHSIFKKPKSNVFIFHILTF